MSVNVMLAGVGFFPHTVAGDKNFWIRLAPLLQERGARMVALSINDQTGISEMAGGLKLFNFKRSFHLGDPSRFYSTRGGGVDYKHKHHRAVDSLEILLTAARNLRTIRRIVRSEEIQVIHFMDNSGPAMRFLKKRIPGVSVTNSQLRYNGGKFYEGYIRSSMFGLNRTVAYSESCRKQLISAGIPSDNIDVVRWGVLPSFAPPDPEMVKSTRERLGIPPGADLILWSGFILHIQRPDFEAAATAAGAIAAERPNCHFVFSFKPMCFSQEFKQFESERVTVTGDLAEFQHALASADFFLSPSTRSDASVAPPLTWLETMNYGTPVITTQGSGVDEVIEHGVTGYVADTMQDLPEAVDNAISASDRLAVRQRCREVVAAKFDIRKSADQYIKIWESLAER